jgi:hypothetical protein
MMNKIFSILLCCLCLGNSQTALFSKNYKEQNPNETPRSTENQRPPVARQLFPSIHSTGQITIPGIPATMQPTREQAAGMRTPEGAQQLHQAFVAQAPAAFANTNQDPDPNSRIDGSSSIANEVFSESELSSEDDRAQTPRPTRTTARQNNLTNSCYTQVRSNHRNFIGEARSRHLQRTTRVGQETREPINAALNDIRQEFIARLQAVRGARIARQQAARRARQERNNRRYNYYDAQD